MDAFVYRNRKLFCEEVPVADVAAKVGTPVYLYSQTALENSFRRFDAAFASVPHITCYAVKANSNLAILTLLRALGAGFDVVSGGELMRALRSGMNPKKIVFSGVGKTEDELDLGLHRGILQFNLESAAELTMLEARARAIGTTANVGLRVNPDVDARTHPYIATGTQRHKFGIAQGLARQLYSRASRSRHLRITGIGCHIGSQITSVKPFVEAIRRLKELCLDLRAEGITIRNLDIGGGLGIAYKDESPPDPEAYARAVLRVINDVDCTLILEPGRVIIGNAGILVTKVVLTKRTGNKNFVVVDAGMNDLIRPSLYSAYHEVQPVALARRDRWKADVVGPICESGDFLARDRLLPVLKANELLAIKSAGAYGFVLSSNYNSRPRPAEVLVLGDRFRVIRARERFQDLIRGETDTPFKEY